MHLIQVGVGGTEIYWSNGQAHMRSNGSCRGMWYTCKNGHSGWTPSASSATTLEEIRREMLEKSSQGKSDSLRRNIIEELSLHILRDSLATIDWYLASCYPWPMIPNLCANVHTLAPEYDFSAMAYYTFPGSHHWGCYRGIIHQEKEYFAFNLGDISQEWWFGDENGRNKVMAGILITRCLNRRARELQLEHQKNMDHQN